ncbi:MAG: methyltransferase domain-containing protein [Acidimicrobiia bacterium]|nr:methyltransferase domain-containing protein [Acidimicrobiia bacterium]
MSDDTSEAEFDVEARWTVDAVSALGTDHAVPAACRGSGGPAALDWLGRQLGLDAGTRLLDVGGGLGGPAAYARSTFGASATVVEPMPRACEAAMTLFGLPAVQATVEALPFADAGCERLWCIGVLCTVDDLGPAVRSLSRITRRDGLIGLLVYVRTVAEVEDEPATNHFPSAEELDRHLADSGLAVRTSTTLDAMGSPPDDWDQRADAVDRWIQQAHESDDRWQEAHAAEERIGQLLEEGTVEGHLLVAQRVR